MIETVTAKILPYLHAYGVPVLLVAAALVLTIFVRVYSRRGTRQRRQKRLKVWREKQALTYYGAVKKMEDARSALETRNGGTMVVDIVHDISSTKTVIPGDIYPAITFDQAVDVLEQLRDADPNGPVDIVLHTLGGFSLAAEIVAGALKAHKGKVTAYIPYIAMSGGTMLALACDHIKLSKNALLGPIDTQYSGYPASAFKRLLEAKKDAIGDLSDAYFLRAITSIDDDEDARRKVKNMLGEEVAEFFLEFQIASRLRHRVQRSIQGPSKPVREQVSGRGLHVRQCQTGRPAQRLQGGNGQTYRRSDRCRARRQSETRWRDGIAKQCGAVDAAGRTTASVNR